MEACSILQFFENKRILVTGATGFLGKVFVEKILRVQPNVKKLYLLMRAKDSLFALHRFNSEVMAKDLFKVLKERHGENLESFIQKKVTLLCGDITRGDLGLEASTLQELFGEVEVVVNLAATTNFDERYDIALGINTFGAANVLNFSKKCRNLRVFLHVSTAYVCGEEEGLILETPLRVGDTFGLDIEMETKFVDQKLKELNADQVSDNYITSVMKDFGWQRANKYGWPNTYSFTKAMGEMLIGHLKEKTPLLIIRPTIVTSTFKQPFPGWVEGVRGVDIFFVGYGKGKMRCVGGDPHTITDLIPADMVVNAMMASMAAHADEPTEMVYHVGSSVSNPVSFQCVQNYGFHFFREQPWMNKDGKAVIVTRPTQLTTRVAVRRYMQLHFIIPLKILGVVNILSCGYFKGVYVELSGKVKFFRRMMKLFTPYIFFKGVFDDMNTEKLRRAAKERGDYIQNQMFQFDPKIINWTEYFMYSHIPAVVKYNFRRG